MTRCILCAVAETSGSRHAGAGRHAASIAARLARDLDSRALLLHVAGAGGLLQRAAPWRIVRARRMRRGLKAIVDEQSFPDGAHIQVKAGHTASILMAVAEREDAELIVVGAGGWSTVSPALLGSVTCALMREAPCPVVVVPSGTVAPFDAEGMRSVVCGIAGDETDSALLQLAGDLAIRLGAELHAVHAYDPSATHAADPGASIPPRDAGLHESAEQRLALALQEAGVEAQASALPGLAAEALERVAEQHRAGLIVVGARQASKLGSTLLGSVPTQLAAQGGTPVVVLPLGARLERGSGHYEAVAGPA
jgi:nucleotide-binding universal stress UspA family protein